MKLATARVKDALRLVCLLGEDRVIDLAAAQAALKLSALPPNTWADLQSFIEAGDLAVQALASLIRTLDGAGAAPYIYPLSEVKLAPPIGRPTKNIVCVGRNYKEHVAELTALRGTPASIPDHPIYFTKPYSAIVGPDEAICYSPAVTQKVDYEGELAIVIGKSGRDIPVEQAMQYVYGYTLMNDVSARDLQYRHVQYYKGKSLDTFAPLGPWLLLSSAVPDYRRLHLTTLVNGEVRQSAFLQELIFDIPMLIATLSQGITLHAGDIIATGTPSGVGGSFEPQRFLKHRDVVDVTIAEIGTLRNPVVEL